MLHLLKAANPGTLPPSREDQKPLPHVHEGLRFLPQRLRVGRLSLKQAGEGIVGGGPLLFRRTSGRLRAGENLLGRDQDRK